MNKFPLDITKDILALNNLKSITLMSVVNDTSTPPRLILDRGEETEKIIDGEEEINKFIENIKK
jgi:hypothetical protein